MTGTLHNAQGQGPEDGIALSPSNTFEESESIVEDATNADWLKFNILSLDGGGIRGYWSLLALQRLMEFIAEAEEKDSSTFHSFYPQRWPRDVSQVPLNENEKILVNDAESEEDKARAHRCARRYLPCHYFDNVCGSSTGALIAIMLGRFRMTVPDCIYEYERLGQEVFGKPRFFASINIGITNRHKYSAANLAKVFKEVTRRRDEKIDGEVFGKITFPSRRGLCTTFVTTKKSGAKGHSGTEYLIRSYDHDKITAAEQSIMRSPIGTGLSGRTNTGVSAGPSTRIREKGKRTLNYEKAQEYEIWQVARAATAAPLYFEPLKVEKARETGHILFTDGGFSNTNNPTRRAQLEIEELHGAGSIGIVVSVGTARKKWKDKSSRWLHFFNKIPREMKGMAHELSDPEVVHGDMQRESERDKQQFPYYRLNHPDGLDIDLDCWEPKQSLFNKNAGSKTIETITNAFAHWAGELATIQHLKNCAEILVKCRRKRMNTPKWERFATGARYRCRYERCDREDIFEGNKFEEHLRKHGLPEEELKKEMDYCRDHWRY